jgi:hypothetical protein
MTFIVQNYPGAPRPQDSIAIIRVDSGNGPDVISVDDVPLRVTLESPNRVHVEVLPGPHEVDVEVIEREIGLRHVLPVRFIAEAGKVYRVEVLEVAAPAGLERHWDAHAYEVDRDFDSRLRVAAPVGAPPSAPAPPAPAAVAPDAIDAGAPSRAPADAGGGAAALDAAASRD